MAPIMFPEQTKVLAAPDQMSDCEPLPVWCDGQVCISCWRPTWRERLSILLFGRVWCWVWHGPSQPPITLQGERQIFQAPRAGVVEGGGL